MKKLSLLFIAVFCAILAQAQVTSLHEDFNVSCATGGSNYPLNWSEWNTTPPVTALAWTCTELGGRYGTPGIRCNSYFGGVHYKDTAWLFTPQLDLSAFTDSVYLRFDSRYDIFGARLSVLTNNDYIQGTSPDTMGIPIGWLDVADRTTPVIGPDDSAKWATHYVNLTQFKNIPLYVAFRYTSTNTTGGAWTIDNVFLTPWGLSVDQPNKKSLELAILGNSTTNSITFSGTFNKPGNYHVSIYNTIGKEVHTEDIYANSGISSHTLGNLKLVPGLYLMKVGDETGYEVIKVSIQ